MTILEFISEYYHIMVSLALFIGVLIVIFQLRKYDAIDYNVEAKLNFDKVDNLMKLYQMLIYDYEQLLETQDEKDWSVLRFHILELKDIVEKRMEELK